MPVDEQKLLRDNTRAQRAKELVENELLQEAFQEIEAAYLARWRVTHLDDNVGREKLFLAVNVVGKVKDHLTQVIASGSVAAKELDNLAKDAERKRRFGIV